MDRKEQLVFCKKCRHKSFDLQQGIVCGITGQKADFEETCGLFKEKEEHFTRIEEDEDLSLKAIGQFIRRVLKERFITTPLVILSCVAYYIVVITLGHHVFNPDEFTLVKYGANAKFLTLNGEYWRLITGAMLHANVEHLVVNIFALFSIGFLLERVIGSFRMALLIVVTGIAASAFSILMVKRP